MKKKIFLLMLLVSIAFYVKGQVDARGLNIYYGQPQKCEIIDDAGNILTVTYFDEDGYITSMRGGNVEYRYEWMEDRTRTAIKVYMDGEYKDVNYVNVIENTDRILRIEGGGGELVTVFSENGRVDYATGSVNGVTQRQEYVYSSEEAMYPTQIVLIDSRQPQMRTISKQRFGEGFDELGNAIDWTFIINEGTMNEMTQRVRRTIYYY